LFSFKPLYSHILQSKTRLMIVLTKHNVIIRFFDANKLEIRHDFIIFSYSDRLKSRMRMNGHQESTENKEKGKIMVFL